MMNAIQTEGLTKFYGRSRGIIDLDLEVREGEFYGFIGPNGAGKSTTIRILMGLIHRTRGSAWILGRDISREKEQILSEIGYLPSEAVFYPDMRGRLLIRSSKSRSSRYAQLSEQAWQLILQYWYSLPADVRPRDWLFPQKRNPSKPIDHQRVPDFIRAHEKHLGWERRFTCHTFRHAFATYHYEDGTDLLTLKALMGHRSIASTTIYVHLSSRAFSFTPSPFDKMGGMFHE